MNTITPAAPAAVSSSDTDQARVRKAARAFESLLVQSLIKTMRRAQLEDGFFGEGTGSSTYEAMFDRYLADSLAERSPLGIAGMLEAQWLERPSPGAAEEAIRAVQEAAAWEMLESAAGEAVVPLRQPELQLQEPDGELPAPANVGALKIKVPLVQDDKNSERPGNQEGKDHED